MKKIIVRILLGVLVLAILLAVGYFSLIGYLMHKNVEARKNRPYQAQEAQMFREMAEGKTETQAEGLPPELKTEMNQYMKDAKGINDAWKYLRLGGEAEKIGNYEQAANFFRQAYEADSGSRHVSGFDLAYTLQKLGKYQEAVDLLDGMIVRRETNDVGIRKAQGLKQILIESIKKQQEAKAEVKT